MLRREQQGIECSGHILRGLLCKAQSAFGVVLAREEDGQRSRTGGVVPADRRRSGKALAAGEAGRHAAVGCAATVSELDDVPIDGQPSPCAPLCCPRRTSGRATGSRVSGWPCGWHRPVGDPRCPRLDLSGPAAHPAAGAQMAQVPRDLQAARHRGLAGRSPLPQSVVQRVASCGAFGCQVAVAIRGDCKSPSLRRGRPSRRARGFVGDGQMRERKARVKGASAGDTRTGRRIQRTSSDMRDGLQHQRRAATLQKWSSRGTSLSQKPQKHGRESEAEISRIYDGHRSLQLVQLLHIWSGVILHCFILETSRGPRYLPYLIHLCVSPQLHPATQ